MRPNPQSPKDLVTFTEEIPNGKLHFLCSVSFYEIMSLGLILKFYQVENLTRH